MSLCSSIDFMLSGIWPAHRLHYRAHPGSSTPSIDITEILLQIFGSLNRRAVVNSAWYRCISNALAQNARHLPPSNTALPSHQHQLGVRAERHWSVNRPLTVQHRIHSQSFGAAPCTCGVPTSRDHGQWKVEPHRLTFWITFHFVPVYASRPDVRSSSSATLRSCCFFPCSPSTSFKFLIRTSSHSWDFVFLLPSAALRCE